MSNAYHVCNERIKCFQNCIRTSKGVGYLTQQDTLAHVLLWWHRTARRVSWLLHRDVACIRTNPLMDTKPSMASGCFEMPQRSQHNLDCLQVKNLQGFWKTTVAPPTSRFFLRMVGCSGDQKVVISDFSTAVDDTNEGIWPDYIILVIIKELNYS